jgi:predicted phosphodiesterase
MILGAYYRFSEKKGPSQLQRVEHKVVLLAVGDTGTESQAQMQVASAMEGVCATHLCDAAFILGDVIYDKGVSTLEDTQFKTKFEVPYQALDIPFYIALGNHDHLGCIECYIQYTSLSSKWEFPSYYYKKSFGELVDVFVLDTEIFDQAQAAWLEKKLLGSTSSWKIAVGHHPIYTNSKSYKEAYPEKKALLSQAICNNFDVYLAGHSHDLEYIGQKCDVDHIVSGGGGASLYETLPSQSLFSAQSHGFVLLEAEQGTITISFFNEKAELLYSSNKKK